MTDSTVTDSAVGEAGESDGVRPLAGLRVVDLSTWIAGAYAARLLTDGGATVTRVEPEGGHPLRAWSASGSIPTDGSGRRTEDGALFRHLAAGTTTTVVGPARGAAEGDGGAKGDGDAGLHEVLAGADACLWSPGGRLDPEAIAAAHPDLVVVAVAPFGLTGPWRDRPATELTLQAWSGGVIGLGRGDPERPPVHVAGQVGEWLAGTYAAVGLLTARRAGTTGIVDLSMLEVEALCLTYHPVTYHDLVGRPMRTRRALTVPGVAQAKDGLVGLGVGTGQQWLDFCAMTGHPEWTEDVSLFSERGALATEIDAWVGPQPMAEVLDLATAFRIPNAPIVDGANAPTIDHLRERGSFTHTAGDDALGPRPPLRITRSDVRTDRPDRPARPDPPAAEPEPGAGARPFEGLRILDMTAYWAGPSATHLFAMLGAEVIHLESGTRPDGARSVGVSPKITDRPWERGPIFTALNTGKKSVTLDFSRPEGLDLLRRLIASCDVVVENYTPRVLDQLGLDGDGLRALRDDLIVVRMPGFGLDGPWRDNAAFAFVIEDASGLTWLTGHPDAHPVEPYCIGDSNAGIHAALGLLLALAHRDATGEGCQVEAAMIDAALSITAEQVVEHSAYGVRLERDGNRGPAAAPQDLYECAEPAADPTATTGTTGTTGRRRQEPPRVAIAVATDDQWLGLRRALGEPAWAADAALATHAGRATARDLIDEHLRPWCAARTADQVVEALWDEGVPVAEVRQPHDQPDLEPLRARGFFETVDHPVSGPARCATLPFRLPGGPERLHLRPAPLLGEHTEALLRGLGLDDDELAALTKAGVTAGITATEPGGAT